MSSQRGNASRSRAQKHQNSTAFKNDKFGASVQVKKANSKIHDGLCQHCKGVLEWKVKYKKYKTLTQPRKCIKCSQKTVKDAYHVICKPCSLELEICCKCGDKADIVIPVNLHLDQEEEEDDKDSKQKSKMCKKNLDSDDEFDDEDDEDFVDLEDKEDEESKSVLEKTQSKSVPLPDVSRVNIMK
ncbi:uncharacterized protein C9orf85 homolog isoform X1 [Phycodurus eques]|uniref:uncharacterized protein C9orf85 homolog isoform X1 n=1 Tax=Phycodurus eques TaxID=693459 RepID=UPI002ACD792A|nr:uncharacterized protein C9orf85 homolog isoform X1 [Phycodurus eques]XP_061528187.1 uncharacterized protein C9orf85 homolog isoform X1 [Phycodurus eques]